MIALVAFYGIVACSLLFALVGGGRAERAGAIVLAIMIVIALVPRPFAYPSFNALDPVALADDLFGFAAFAWIGYRARRYWPLCAAALQLLSVGSHFVRMMIPIDAWAYALTKSVPTGLVCLALIWGTAAYRRRRRAWQQESCPHSRGPASPANSSETRWRG